MIDHAQLAVDRFDLINFGITPYPKSIVIILSARKLDSAILAGPDIESLIDKLLNLSNLIDSLI